MQSEKNMVWKLLVFSFVFQKLKCAYGFDIWQYAVNFEKKIDHKKSINTEPTKIFQLALARFCFRLVSRTNERWRGRGSGRYQVPSPLHNEYVLVSSMIHMTWSSALSFVTIKTVNNDRMIWNSVSAWTKNVVMMQVLNGSHQFASLNITLLFVINITRLSLCIWNGLATDKKNFRICNTYLRGILLERGTHLHHCRVLTHFFTHSLHNANIYLWVPRIYQMFKSLKLGQPLHRLTKRGWLIAWYLII